MRSLTVEPTGGLGNRLRVVDSAAALAARHDVPLRVVWTRTPDLNSRLDRLFEPAAGVRVLESGWPRSRLRRRILRMLRYHDLFLDQPAVELRMRAGTLSRDLAASRRPFLITCSRFHVPGLGLRSLVPVARLRASVEEVARGFTAPTLGVHVRRGDNQAALRASPTELFVERMAAELRANPATRFFLATDSPADEERLLREFQGRVIVLPKRLDRNDPRAAEGAVVDLFCLARTRKVLGSYWSSFSEAAAELGGVPLEIITASER